MKIFIVLILSCLPVLATDTNIQVFTTSSVTGVHHDGIFRRDLFTRAGHTNLICDTWTRNDGALATHMQSFYRDRLLVAMSIPTTKMQNFITEAGSPYSLQFALGPSENTAIVYFIAKNGEIVDEFTCTNGVYYPADVQLILEENDRMKRTRDLN